MRVSAICFGRAVGVGKAYCQAIVAGCTFATTMLKMFFIESMDAFVVQYTSVHIRLYLDDVAMRWNGFVLAELHAFLRAVEALTVVIESDLFLPLNTKKNKFIVSDRKVRDFIELRMLDLGIRHSVSAPYLGVDQSCGATAHASTNRTRFQAFRSRISRIRMLARHKGPTANVLKCGITPSIMYPASVYGVSDSVLRTTRGRYAASLPTWKPGSSTTLSLHTASLKFLDPIFPASTLPIIAWAKTVFERKMSLADACRVFVHARDRLVTARDPWASVQGPCSGALLSAARIGWSFGSGLCAFDHLDTPIHFVVTPPKKVEWYVNRSVAAYNDVHTASSLEAPHLASGILWHPLMRILRPCPKSKKRWSPQRIGMLRCIINGSVWDKQRKCDAGYVDNAICDRCGLGVDNMRHRAIICTHPPIEEARDNLSLDLLRDLENSDTHSPFVNRCLLPVDVADVPAPIADIDEVSFGSSDYVFKDFIMLDGSGIDNLDPNLVRCAYAVTTTNEDGYFLRGVAGSLPGDLQSVPRSEIFALYRGLVLSRGKNVLFVSDCALVVNTFKAGVHGFNPSSNLHADLWTAIFREAEGRLTAIAKVKSHLSETQAHAKGAEYLAFWRGNRDVDELAKSHARNVARVPQLIRNRAACSARKLVEYCNFIVDVCIDCVVVDPPRKLVSRVRRGPCQPRATLYDIVDRYRMHNTNVSGSHKLKYSHLTSRTVQCLLCRRHASCTGSLRSLLSKPCQGPIVDQVAKSLSAKLVRTQPSVAPALSARQSHTLVVTGRITWCTKCGKYPIRRLKGLSARCEPAVKGTAGWRALDRLEAGLHPVTKVPL